MIEFFKDLPELKAEKNEIVQQINQVVKSGHYILGEQVKAFESEFAHYNGANFCVGVGNGSDALFMAIRAFEFEPGSEILLAENSFIASALAVVHNGCIPIPIPIQENTYNIDAAQITPFINANTKAILVTHMYGQMCNMDAVISIANLFGLKVIEDCAHAHGASHNGKFAGTFGHIAAFSFYPTKNLGAMGDAGAVITNDSTLYEKVVHLRNYGISPLGVCSITGINSRLDEMQAAILRVKLKYLNDRTKKRQQMALFYNEKINNMHITVYPPVFTHVYHLFVIRCKQRDLLQNHLLQAGIQTKVHYPKPYYLQIPDCQKPQISSEVYEQVLSLPLYPGLKRQQQKEIVHVLNQF